MVTTKKQSGMAAQKANARLLLDRLECLEPGFRAAAARRTASRHRYAALARWRTVPRLWHARRPQGVKEWGTIAGLSPNVLADVVSCVSTDNYFNVRNCADGGTYVCPTSTSLHNSSFGGEPFGTVSAVGSTLSEEFVYS